MSALEIDLFGADTHDGYPGNLDFVFLLMTDVDVFRGLWMGFGFEVRGFFGRMGCWNAWR